MLSIFPLLMFLIALIPFFHLDVAQIEQFINDYVPYAIAEVITTIILDTISEPRGGLLSIGIIVTLWSASNGINAFIRAINRSYNIEETRNFLHQRILSMLLTFAILVTMIIKTYATFWSNFYVNHCCDGTQEFFLECQLQFVVFLFLIYQAVY